MAKYVLSFPQSYYNIYGIGNTICDETQIVVLVKVEVILAPIK